ncbi:energy-coupling factor transport system ATP-binding protein [Brevibacterium siliguriense]|uniref:Energy-coupling factor transport system ATP-binding protein n=1 Tax=Brevibacterium siliguriense TaxID=1136497 RepID=A0A1H1WZH0_9MICO|nr:ABC transporter ATP-binding protein [Brevibacterium siliguriense]SDT02352.1 energy-coupling factor transport system ATP-binding protein [Brevibacterium siliguriense]
MALPITAAGYSWTHTDRDLPAVGPLDLKIAAGEKVLLLGASGAGKSTFLHAVAGVLPEESGEATGELLVGDGEPDPRRGSTGLVLQDPDSQVIFSRIGDDVAFGMENLGLPAEVIEARIPESLRALGLDLPPEHPSAALSGGQKQRLALAGIHAMAPEVIVLDEPTANIDPASAAGVRDAVLTVQSETAATMLVVEHRVELWIDHVDRVVVLGRDGILVQGPPRQIFTDPDLTDVLIDCGIWMPQRSPTPRRDGSDGTNRTSGRLGEVLLRTDRLSVARPRMTTPAATDLELSLHTGQALGIVGANGAGKSTTALTLAGLLPEFSGQVLAEAALREGAKRDRPFAWPSKQLAARIGMVFQEPAHQFLTSSVAAELELGPRLAGWSAAESQARVDELLEGLGLTGLAFAHPQSLSGGEKRRLSVAAMLAPRPRVLIVDEPTFGQDALTWAGLVEMFLDTLGHGSAVVAVSHDLAFLEAIGADLLEPGDSSSAVCFSGSESDSRVRTGDCSE